MRNSMKFSNLKIKLITWLWKIKYIIIYMDLYLILKKNESFIFIICIIIYYLLLIKKNIFKFINGKIFYRNK